MSFPSDQYQTDWKGQGSIGEKEVVYHKLPLRNYVSSLGDGYNKTDLKPNGCIDSS